MVHVMDKITSAGNKPVSVLSILFTKLTRNQAPKVLVQGFLKVKEGGLNK